jgi:riboflavin transporter FmnP
LTRERLDGLYLMMLGGVMFLLLGVVLENTVPGPMSDFKAIYYAARCVIHHSDPYKDGEILKEYRADGGEFPADPNIAQSVRRAVLTCINLPTSLFLVAPFALLPWGPAHALWMIGMAACLLLAAYLMWNLSAGFEPVIAGALIGFVLANSEVLTIIGNAAGIVIGLCLVAVWCFVKRRFEMVGVLCLALSLTFKPHDAGFVWLYFLLVGGVFRKRALQALAVTAVLCLPAVLWVGHVSPHWMVELHNNLAATSARGDLNDPGPTSMGAHTLGMVVSLQTVTSLWRDEPGFYNVAAYLIAGPLILIWIAVTLRRRFTMERGWLALAAIAALSLLPVYHRIYDAKLLLLTVPACAMLWAEGGVTGKLALAVNAAAFVLTGDLPWVIFSVALGYLRPMMPWFSDTMLTAVVVFPAPMALLAMSIFYLWVYARRGSEPSLNAAQAAEVAR